MSNYFDLLFFLQNYLLILESHFGVCVKACDAVEETDTRQCDIDTLERQQIYDEDWVSSLSDSCIQFSYELQQNVVKSCFKCRLLL